MNSRNAIETMMGFIVLVIAFFFIMIAYNSGHITKAGNGYSVLANFNNIGGLYIGSEVRISGIKVGTVSDQKIDQKTGLYHAIVTMDIHDNIQIPKDTTAAIVSDGLLGSRYVALEPGGSDDFLVQGDIIKRTQSSISLEALIGKFVFGAAEDEVGADSGSGTSNSLGL